MIKYIAILITLFVCKISNAQSLFSTTFEPIFSNNYVYDSINDVHILETIDTKNRLISGTVMYNLMEYQPKKNISFNYSYTSNEVDSAVVIIYTIDTVAKKRVDLATYPLSSISDQFYVELDSLVPPYFCFGLMIKSTTSSSEYKKMLTRSELTWNAMYFGYQNNARVSLPYTISPNPTNGWSKITSTGKIKLLSIKNSIGFNVDNSIINQLSDNILSIDLYAFPSGIYTINTLINGQLHAINLIKN